MYSHFRKPPYLPRFPYRNLQYTPCAWAMPDTCWNSLLCCSFFRRFTWVEMDHPTSKAESEQNLCASFLDKNHGRNGEEWDKTMRVPELQAGFTFWTAFFTTCQVRAVRCFMPDAAPRTSSPSSSSSPDFICQLLIAGSLAGSPLPDLDRMPD